MTLKNILDLESIKGFMNRMIGNKFFFKTIIDLYTRKVNEGINWEEAEMKISQLVFKTLAQIFSNCDEEIKNLFFKKDAV